MATLLLKACRNEQHSCFSFSMGKLELEMLLHPPYSPDLASSDYHLFGPMKKMLGRQKFAFDTEVQSTVYQWLRQQPASLFFASGIQKLVDRWDTCLNEFG